MKYVYVPCDESLGRRSDFVYLQPNQAAFHLDAEVSTNSAGIRDREVALVSPADTIRVLTMGDSHTFGYGVKNEDTWPRQLARELSGSRAVDGRQFEVINGGIEGLSLQQELQFFKEKLSRLRPDHLILAYYWNDMPIVGHPDDPIAGVDMAGQFRSCDDPSGHAGGLAEEGKSALSQRLVKKVALAMRGSYLLYSLVQRLPFLQMTVFPAVETQWKRTVLAGGTTPRVEASWEFVRGELTEWKLLGDQAGFQLTVVIVPLFEQMTTGGYASSAYQSRLAGIAAEVGIPVVDPLTAIRAIEPSYPADFVPFDGHPTGRIYQVIAKEVFDYLMPQAP